MNEHPTETQPETQPESGAREELERGVDTLVEIGRMWASHGLRIGRSALETSARTLDVTAETLSDLADRFESKTRG